MKLTSNEFPQGSQNEEDEEIEEEMNLTQKNKK